MTETIGKTTIIDRSGIYAGFETRRPTRIGESVWQFIMIGGRVLFSVQYNDRWSQPSPITDPERFAPIPTSDGDRKGLLTWVRAWVTIDEAVQASYCPGCNPDCWHADECPLTEGCPCCEATMASMRASISNGD